LAVPEAEEPLEAEDVLDDGDGLQRGLDDAGFGFGDLDLAFYELDRGEEEGGEGAGEGAGEPEGGEREALVAGGEAGGVDGLSPDALEEEEAAGFDGGADERGADASVEPEETIGPDGLAEAVQWALVSEGQVVWLGL
jgi:hypothetical protein